MQHRCNHCTHCTADAFIPGFSPIALHYMRCTPPCLAKPALFSCGICPAVKKFRSFVSDAPLGKAIQLIAGDRAVAVQYIGGQALDLPWTPIMLFSPRMSLKQLAAFSQRASMCLLAGIDERTICVREAKTTRGLAARRHLTAISQTVNQGGTLSEGLAATGDFFPPLFREMVHVGEQSGHLGEVLKQLADHYQNQITLRRNFLASITWPAIELFLAIAIVGLLIWIMGIDQRLEPKAGRSLGVGARRQRRAGQVCGLRRHRRHRAGVCDPGRDARPVLDASFAAIHPADSQVRAGLADGALARLAWVMSQTMNTSMDLRRSLKLSLQSTRNARYIDRIERIDAEIAAGNSIYEAFCEAGGFPDDFLESIHVGEQSGNLVESMANVSNLYQEQARAALSVLATVGGFAVWVAVAAIIISLIFRLAMFYLSVLNGAGLP